MNMCLVTGYLYDGSGQPMVGTLVTAFPDKAPFFASSTGQIISRSLIEAITSSTGYFSINLIQSVEYCINIKEIGYKEAYRVPAASTAILFTSVAEYISETSDIIPVGATSTGFLVPTTAYVATTDSTIHNPFQILRSQAGSSPSHDPDTW